MSSSIWGPSTWNFFHTITEKIKDENYNIIKIPLISFLIQISHNLPCPICQEHSKNFWYKINTSNIHTKNDLKNVLFLFHNIVNKRKNKPLFNRNNLNEYSNNNLLKSYINFRNNFNTRGNMKLIHDTFYRNKILNNLNKWLLNNIKYFNL
jgi:hypothetical protein